MEKNDLFVVIDGSALMCVCYYGNLPEEVKLAKTDEEKENAYQFIEQSSKGVFTNGMKSFLNTILSIIENQNPSHLAICFDENRESTFRRQMYKDYKRQRPQTPVPLAKQMRNIQTLLRAIGIPILSSAEFEADDYAGSLCKHFENEIPVRFMTKDRDYLQLISENTKGWMMTHSENAWLKLCDKYGTPGEYDVPFGCYEFDKDIVYGEYGLYPSQITDWKGISGDVSDNIPGIKGISDKNAIPLLQEYETLEGIISAVETAEKNDTLSELKMEWKTNLGLSRPPISPFLSGKEDGLFCKQLATIKTDLDIGVLEDYKTDINFSLLKDLAIKLEIFDIIPRIEAKEYCYESDEVLR